MPESPIPTSNNPSPSGCRPTLKARTKQWGVSMETREFRLAERLEVGALEAWIEEAGLRRTGTAGVNAFPKSTFARAQLIRDLGNSNDEGIGVILDLFDQLHGLRRTLRDLLSTIHAQPEAAQRRMLSDNRAKSQKRRRT
jgi:chaperone modulatory protein CbpM